MESFYFSRPYGNFPRINMQISSMFRTKKIFQTFPTFTTAWDPDIFSDKSFISQKADFRITPKFDLCKLIVQEQGD